MSGFVMDQLGRRTTLILLEVPAIIGWILIAFASNVSMIYGGRLLVGLGSGMVAAPSRVYTGEVTQPHLRGTLAALASLGVSLGVLVEYALGAALAWHVVAAISGAIPLLALTLMTLMPESPGWLLSQGREGDARVALSKFRGQTCDVKEEIDDLIRFSEKNHVTKLSFWETLSTLLQPSTLKPFGILTFYFFIYQFSGVNAITFYAVEIFQYSGTDMNKYTATVITGGVRFACTILACVLMRRCGRRPLTMFSGIACGLTMIGLGSYMYLTVQWELAGQEPVARWFPVACIFIFIGSCTIGFLVVPWVMIGEVYPTQVRGVIGGITTCMAHIFVFTVVKTFPYLLHTIQKYGAFWLYGSISLIGTFVLYFLLPETKGKSLEEIEDYFSGRTKTLGNKAPKILKANKGEVLP